MNRPTIFGCAIVLAAICAWLTTGVVRRYALRNGILDVPNSRSSHIIPTARGGGIAIVGVFLVSLFILAFLGLLRSSTAATLIAGGGAIALVGYMDDRHTFPASIRFGVHIAAAMLVVAFVGGVTDHSLRVVGLHGVLAGCLLGVLGLSWTTNLFNFMDGIDGIAASEAVFVSAASAWLNWHYGGDVGITIAMLCLAAATLGFLIWNWPPARIFMGDVGSGFLGFMLVALGLAASQRDRVPIEAWAILGGVFLVDATVTLLRRAMRGDRWFEAHRTHAYQNLARRWKGHLPVTALVIVIDVIWLLPWATLTARFPAHAAIFTAAALVPIVVLALVFGAGRKES